MEVFAGTAVKTLVTFTNPTGVATTPSTVTLEWRFAGGELSTWVYGATGNITKTADGEYSATISTTTAPSRTVTVKWKGTGACAAVSVTTFTVQPAPF